MRLAALALALAGCAPGVIWSGRSPDRARSLVVTEVEGARQRIAVDGAPPRTYDALALDRLAWTERGVVLPARRDGAWWLLDGAREHGPFLAIGDVVVAGAHVAFTAQREDGWRVIAGDVEAGVWDAIDPDIVLDAETGVVAYVATRRGAEHAVWGVRAGPPARTVALLQLGAKGALVAYVDRGERDRLLVDHAEVGAWDEVLELATAAGARRWSAIVAADAGCTLVHDGTAIASAPLLTHLRISEDGAHVAALAPAEDGASIAILLDGAAVATHRRAEGDALAFVPGTGTLVALVEDRQGPRVRVGDRESERYEEIDGPVYARGRVGWVGRRGGRSEVVVDGETIATEAWAGSLRLAREGTGYAYVARAGADRFVVTRRGRWPVPRLFSDTLVVDRTAHHWAALVPDSAARRLEVWIDGQPRVVLDEEELGGALVTRAGGAPVDAVRAIVAGELERATAR